MFRFVAALMLLCGVLAICAPLSSQDYQDLVLADIAENIATYKGKSLTLRLRLKYMDTVFNRLVFYDRKNVDIEFDVESMLKDGKKRNEFLNLHNGMEYVVTFSVKEVGKMGILIGELKDFIPLALLKLPSGK